MSQSFEEVGSKVSVLTAKEQPPFRVSKSDEVASSKQDGIRRLAEAKRSDLRHGPCSGFTRCLGRTTGLFIAGARMLRQHGRLRLPTIGPDARALVVVGRATACLSMRMPSR